MMLVTVLCNLSSIEAYHEVKDDVGTEQITEIYT